MDIYMYLEKKKLFVDTYDYESLSVGSFWWRGIFLWLSETEAFIPFYYISENGIFFFSTIKSIDYKTNKYKNNI